VPEKITKASQIEARNVRLVLPRGEGSNIVPKEEAIRLAEAEGLDLIVVQDDGPMPVVKICDQNKVEYEKQKRQKNSCPCKYKTVQIGLHTQQHDLERFAKQADDFVGEGHHVVVKMDVKGRDRQHRDLIRQQFESFLKMIPSAKPGRLSEAGKSYVQAIS
jgi:translation initiation factor IF-3